MSWWRDGNAYGVFFNRDEKKTRARAEEPALRPGGFLAPLDPVGGGTWLTVNPAGLVVGLLNRWHEGASGQESRGKLVLSLEAYSPFTVVAMDAAEIRRWDWDANRLTTAAAEAPVTSSSFEFEKVRQRRRVRYGEWVGAFPRANLLGEYHAESGEGAFSVRMCREDAQTWSRSRIEVGPEAVCWDYWEEFLDFGKEARHWRARLDREGAK